MRAIFTNFVNSLCSHIESKLPKIHSVFTLTKVTYILLTKILPDNCVSGSGNSDISHTTGNSSLPQDTVCAAQFIKINVTCYPLCDSFEQSPHDVIVALTIIQMFAACYFIPGK